MVASLEAGVGIGAYQKMMKERYHLKFTESELLYYHNVKTLKSFIGVLNFKI
jgi:hypothetical protein